MTPRESSPSSAPRVSVALPLFRSSRFLPIILENLEALDYPNLEILVSDRHVADDAIDRIEERYGDDPRFRFLRNADEADWIDHYNDLLKEATGDYFMWMPHDDSFGAEYVPALAAALDRNPDALLAFGRVEVVDREGSPMSKRELWHPEMRPDEAWSTRTALRLLTTWNPGIAVRGLVRLGPIRDRKLLIRRTRRTVLADMYWVFAVSLIGPLLFVPEISCRKRFYGKSTHARWRYRRRHFVNAYGVLSSYLRDLAPSRRAALGGMATLGLWTVLRSLKSGPPEARRSRLIQPAADALEAVIRRLVAAPKLAPRSSEREYSA
jgi:glycosyltransferase involved in cell wall biosynthesis